MTFESPPLVLGREELKVSPSKGEEYSKSRRKHEHSSSSSSSGSASDSEDLEVSDDDDDRNHKHRKRDSRPQSFDNDNQGVILRRPIRRPNRTGENGELFSASRLPETKNESNASFDRDPLVKFMKHSSGMASLSRASVDLSQRSRTNQSRNGSGSHPDLSASFSRPSIGRGRGRGMGTWSQHDSRFGPLGALDFPSHMAPRGPNLPSLFVGTSLPSAAGAQSASWGSFSFIPGMANGCMDPLHPLSLPGALHSSMGPQLNLSMPRQRCRDFEEQGFCLRGDMCPMEHGVNRIVVEDVQSLSQFNLPVSLPSTHTGGLQAASGPLPSMGASSGLSKNKSIPNKTTKSCATDDGLGLNVLSSAAASGDNDVYDPDQPLWSNDRLDMSRDAVRASISDDTEPFHDGDLLLRDFKLPYKSDGGPPSSANADDSSKYIRGRPGSENKLKVLRKIDNIVTGMGFTENDIGGSEEVAVDVHGGSTQRIHAATAETSQKISNFAPGSRLHKDSRRNVARTTQKAFRTLFVNCIPVKNNRRDGLLSHFQKFGNVIDIYIPLNSEKAFVQFSKRGEAEAALESPEAVMGNRFIRLSWANRDNIVDDNEGMEEANPQAGSARAAPVTLKRSIPRGVESQQSVPKVSSVSACDTSPVSTVQPKALIVNTPKVTPVVQKKRENLEMLKEELRRKQELLEQKRNAFKNQLDKLEKQRVAAKKSGATSEKSTKKQKVEMDVGVIKPLISNPSNCNVSGESPNVLDVNCLRDGFAQDSKNDFPLVLHSTKSSVQMDKLPETSTYRSEVDYQLFGFSILPPLPADFANLAVIEDHFSVFQDLFSVDLEDQEACSACESPKPSLNFSARVLFSTHHSAERAFSDGSCWQGKKLKFAWLTNTAFSKDHGAGQIFSNTNSKEVAIAKFNSELLTDGCSLSNKKVSTCSGMPEAVDGTDNCVNMDVDVANSSLDSTIEVQSCPTMKSPDRWPCHSAIRNEDDFDVGFSQ